jgi:2-methylisocitrate lyase-like PEP mutase family enzyme
MSERQRERPGGRAAGDLAAEAERLRALHHGPDLLVLPNAWDAASAVAVEGAGFPAVATSSGAVARSLGVDDADSMGADMAFAAVARIAAAVGVPVTADLEAGYGLAPEEVTARLLAVGAVGCNLEDTDHHGAGVLVDADAQAARLAGVKEAGRAAGVDLVVNARVDVHLRRVGSDDEQLDEAVRRARLYLEAGADCVYPIGVADEATIARLVEAVPGPVNVLLRPGAPSLDRLAQLGVRRVSLGSLLHRTAQRALADALEGLRAGEGPS